MNSARIIRIAAALVLRDNGDTLLVRKRGTRAFMQPGGKIEASEGPVEALLRELAEEIGLTPHDVDLVPMGQFQAIAANEIDHVVIADVYRLEIGDRVVDPAGEIEEAIWVSPLNPGNIPMAALTEYQILPAYRRGLQA